MRKQELKDIKKNREILKRLDENFFSDENDFEVPINLTEQDLELNHLLEIENLIPLSVQNKVPNTNGIITKILDTQNTTLKSMLAEIENKEFIFNQNEDTTIPATEIANKENTDTDLTINSSELQLLDEPSSIDYCLNEEDMIDHDLSSEESLNNVDHTGDELDSIMCDYFDIDIDEKQNTYSPLNKRLTEKIIFEELNIAITVTTNNIFIHGRNLKTGHLVLYASTGIKHIETSKANLKYNFEYFFLTFFGDNFNFQDPEFFGHYDIISYTIKAPRYMIQTIIDILETHVATNEDDDFSLKSSAHIVEIPYLKAFNGCRGPKKKRLKKKRSHTLFK